MAAGRRPNSEISLCATPKKRRRTRSRCIWAESPKCSVIDSKSLERALREKPVPTFSQRALAPARIPTSRRTAIHSAGVASGP
ncbi:MAG: hypothetical protein FJX45_08440 [Alphaproteobacteria bacterium]|nr:hypothetical protein [Alphaproteobacteria bacterium]MBM3652413.1 hypothetical protein [Alphaproteobacteria bacterium]